MIWRKKLCFCLNHLRFLLILLLSLTIYTMFFYTDYSSPRRLKDMYKYLRSIELYASGNNINSFNNEYVFNQTATLNYTDYTSFYFNSSLPIANCPLIPPHLGSRIRLELKNESFDAILQKLKLKQPRLKLGGRWRPPHCLSRHKVAIVVPYRDRLENLELFLAHMHPFLAKQQLDYGVYLVEPVNNITFNRGFLMNIGFAEALKDRDQWQCFTFHGIFRPVFFLLHF